MRNKAKVTITGIAAFLYFLISALHSFTKAKEEVGDVTSFLPLVLAFLKDSNTWLGVLALGLIASLYREELVAFWKLSKRDLAGEAEAESERNHTLKVDRLNAMRQVLNGHADEAANVHVEFDRIGGMRWVQSAQAIIQRLKNTERTMFHCSQNPSDEDITGGARRLRLIAADLQIEDLRD